MRWKRWVGLRVPLRIITAIKNSFEIHRTILQLQRQTMTAQMSQ